MKHNFLGMMKSEIQRIFSIRYLLVSVIGVLAVLFIATFSWMKQYNYSVDSCFYDIMNTIFCGGFFCELLFVPASFYVLSNLCEDINQKSFYLYSSRVSIRSYIIIKLVVGVLFSFAVTFISMNLYIAIFSLKMKLILPETEIMGAFETFALKYTVLYYIIRSFYISLISALMCGIGMIITSFIPNQYIAATSTFFSFIIIDKIEIIFSFPNEVCISGIIGGLVEIDNEIVRSVVYITLFSCTMLFIVAIIYNKIMKWRCYGERD